MKLRRLLLFVSLLLVATACGSSTSEGVSAAELATATDEAPVPQTSSASDDEADPAAGLSTEDVLADAEESIDGLVDSLEEAQEVAGGGSATLTVGDQSWTFEPLLCAFGEDEIGQEGATFVVSSIQDGTQLYLSIDETWGHSAGLNDISDFENPSVSLDSTGPYTNITLDGTSFTGTGEFLDNTSESFDRLPGTFEGTCP